MSRRTTQSSISVGLISIIGRMGSFMGIMEAQTWPYTTMKKGATVKTVNCDPNSLPFFLTLF